MDLLEQINNVCSELDMAVRSLRQTGKDYAEAYTNYRMELAKELIKLKDEGYAITLAGDIARGKREIAMLKFKEITSEAVYKANLERINVNKLRAKLLDNQLSREWSNEK